MEYRRQLEREMWHFHRDCSQWPRRFNIIRAERLPDNAEICKECKARNEKDEGKKG